MNLLGIDIGSSSVKVSLVHGETGKELASAAWPPEEMEIMSPRPGWAEQDPETWMDCLFTAMAWLKAGNASELRQTGAIGIAYQMHGLIAVDKTGNPVRNAIIWCDSRAVEIGEQAFDDLGREFCQQHLLNSPGNFTASKLKWISLHEPTLYEKIHKIMLPGDYVAFRLTGDILTTASGLSEGIFWDFIKNEVSDELMNFFGFDRQLLPKVAATFSPQGNLTPAMAKKLGLTPGIPVSYRAGDQPNNALSLHVLNPGEVAATAGTSGVVYGVTDRNACDPASRVNTFLHVNHSPEKPRLGILLCLNSVGILYSWLKHRFMPADMSYNDLNKLAAKAPAGSNGLLVLPFGNGAERVLENNSIGGSFHGMNFNTHHREHMIRAVQEGIAFAFKYGLEVMGGMGLNLSVIRAGRANLFLSDLFAQTLADLSGASIQLYNTNGAEGAARGAGIGAGFYKNTDEAFSGLEVLKTVEPQQNPLIRETYEKWKNVLGTVLSTGKEQTK